MSISIEECVYWLSVVDASTADHDHDWGWRHAQRRIVRRQESDVLSQAEFSERLAADPRRARPQRRADALTAWLCRQAAAAIRREQS